MKEIIYNNLDEEIRIDKFLSITLDSYSRSLIAKNIKNKNILVNNKKTKVSYLLRYGDLITIKNLEEDKIKLVPQNIPLEILYEDKDIIIVNKPAGMLVHPSSQVQEGTLVNALIHYTRDLSDLGEYYRPGIVHRLDKDTSGLLVVAKNNESYKKLISQFLDRSVKRSYILLVHGQVEKDEGILDFPIGRDQSNRTKMKVTSLNSKSAITSYRVLKRYLDYTLVEASLYTGRMHQIRVHFSYIGHPIVADPIYNRGYYNKLLGLKRQFLHSYILEIDHPLDSRKMTFEGSLPEDLKVILSQLKNEEV